MKHVFSRHLLVFSFGFIFSVHSANAAERNCSEVHKYSSEQVLSYSQAANGCTAMVSTTLILQGPHRGEITVVKGPRRRGIQVSLPAGYFYTLQDIYNAQQAQKKLNQSKQK